MNYATISADIIASSSLSGKEMDNLMERIYWLFAQINDCQEKHNKEKMFCRLVAGDLIECLIKKPQDSLRIALILKNGIKSFILEKRAKNLATGNHRKLFQTYGVRAAIGIGEMNIDLIDKNILNGDAISRSGRLISDQKTSNKGKAIIKNTLFFDSPSINQVSIFSTIMALLDELSNKTTQKQSEILLYKLLGLNELDVAEKLKIKQSSVNQQSRAAGWNAIEQAVNYFSNFDFSI